MFSNFWGGTGDWPWHNWYAACRRPPNATGFKFFNWDSEGAIIIWSEPERQRDRRERRGRDPVRRPEAEPRVRLLFADHAQRHLFNDGPATPEPSYARYKKLADQVELAIIAESARWGDQSQQRRRTRRPTGEHMRDYILDTYMPQRPAIVLNQLKTAGLYPEVAARSSTSTARRG